jgi:hypothetical protein
MGMEIEDAIVDDIEAKFNLKPETRGSKLYAVFAIAENGEIVSFQPKPNRVRLTELTESHFNDLPKQNLPFFRDFIQAPMYTFNNQSTGLPELAWCWKEGGQKVYCLYSKVVASLSLSKAAGGQV